MKNFTFIVIDDNQKNGLKTKAVAESFQNLHFLGMADNYDDGLDLALQFTPDLVFLEIDPFEKESKLSLALINELHRYLEVVPKVFVTTASDSLCLESFKYGVFDYFINPIESKELRKSLFRLEKEVKTNHVIYQTNVPIVAQEKPQIANDTPVIQNIEILEEHLVSNENRVVDVEELNDSSEIKTTQVEIIKTEETSNQKEDGLSGNLLFTNESKEKPLIICVKSYGDYRYIEAKDICFLQADNNSTDIHLNTGEMITAFKTLKHFEGVLTHPFVRIHNSYIVNIDFVSRIHTGNAVCHIKNTTTKLPFSKSYKENVDAIITTIASGNYLEI